MLSDGVEFSSLKFYTYLNWLYYICWVTKFVNWSLLIILCLRICLILRKDFLFKWLWKCFNKWSTIYIVCPNSNVTDFFWKLLLWSPLFSNFCREIARVQRANIKFGFKVCIVMILNCSDNWCFRSTAV